MEKKKNVIITVIVVVVIILGLAAFKYRSQIGQTLKGVEDPCAVATK